MRSWTRAGRDDRLCDHCDHRLSADEPMQEIRLPGVKRVLGYCSRCADGPVPPDLPPLVQRDEMAPMTSARAIASGMHLPLDYKKRQTGESS